MRPLSASAAIPDLTHTVTPTLACSPRVEGVAGGYTDGDRFFFADADVIEIASAIGGRLLVRSDKGWLQRGNPSTTLGRCVINGDVHFQFPDEWRWSAYRIGPQRRRTAPTPRTFDGRWKL